MFTRTLLFVCLMGLMSACSNQSQFAETKSMVTVKQKLYHYLLLGDAREVKPYAVEALGNSLRTLPLKHIVGAEIVSNDPEFIHSKGSEQLQLALWRKGIGSDRVHHSTVKSDEPTSANLIIHYRDVDYPQGCPEWQDGFRHKELSAFSCANTINLGHMLANPRDVLESQGDHAPVIESAAASVQRMHEGEFLLRKPNYETATTDLE